MARRADLAPPLDPKVWRLRLAAFVVAITAALPGAVVVIWACIRYGDWRTASDGGYGKLLLCLVITAAVVPVVITWKFVHVVPQLDTARRREPGRWMRAVGFSEAREEKTGNLFFRRTALRDHWWLALFPVGSEASVRPELVVEVSERSARTYGGGQVVAVHGHGRFGNAAVVAVGDNAAVVAVADRVVWPKRQDSELPAGAQPLGRLPW